MVKTHFNLDKSSRPQRSKTMLKLDVFKFFWLEHFYSVPVITFDSATQCTILSNVELLGVSWAAACAAAILHLYPKLYNVIFDQP